jgi:hypothetical protein
MYFTSPFTVRTYGATDNNANNLATTFVREQQPGPNPIPMLWVILVVMAGKAAVGGVKRAFGQADSESTTSTGTYVTLVYLPSGLSGREQEFLTSMHGLLETVGLSWYT